MTALSRGQSRTRALLVDAEGGLFGVMTETSSAVVALETQAQVDARSDALLLEVGRLLGLIERDPERAVELARIAKVYQARGLELDALEDDHRADALNSVGRSRSLAQQIIGWIGSYFGCKGAAPVETARERVSA